jgi:hypothetical protein
LEEDEIEDLEEQEESEPLFVPFPDCLISEIQFQLAFLQEFLLVQE